MEETGAIKSYLPSELNLIQATSENSKPATCKLKPYDSVRSSRSQHMVRSESCSIMKSGLCKIRMISEDIVILVTTSRRIPESKVRGVYSDIIREYMENSDEFGYKVCDRSINSYWVIGVLTTERREVTTRAISNCVRGVRA